MYRHKFVYKAERTQYIYIYTCICIYISSHLYDIYHVCIYIFIYQLYLKLYNWHSFQFV